MDPNPYEHPQSPLKGPPGDKIGCIIAGVVLGLLALFMACGVVCTLNLQRAGQP